MTLIAQDCICCLCHLSLILSVPVVRFEQSAAATGSGSSNATMVLSILGQQLRNANVNVLSSQAAFEAVDSTDSSMLEISSCSCISSSKSDVDVDVDVC